MANIRRGAPGPLSLIKVLIPLILLSLASGSLAADFTVPPDSGPQTLTGNETGVIEDGGSLVTGASVAVTLTNNSNDLDNAGSISTTGGSAYAVYLDSSDSSAVQNNGSISTIGANANAVYLTSSDSSAVQNDGSISAAGGSARGIYLLFSHNNVVQNNGSISTTGLFGDGILLDKSNFNSVNNSGSISTTKDEAYGIFVLLSDNNTVNSSGSIATQGARAHGIFLLDSDNNSVNNSGSIATEGTNAHGIYLRISNNNSVHNFGSINTTGTNAIGIRLDGTLGAVVNNYGGIFATGLSTQAIEGSDNDDILNLFSRSQIFGSIDLMGGADTVNIYFGKAGTSSTLTFENTEFVNLFGPNMVNIGGTDIYTVVDPTAQSVQGAVLGEFTDGLHNMLFRRGSTGQAQPAQLASTRVEQGMLPPAEGPQIWSSVFGSHRARDEDGRVLAYDHNYYGFAGGYETTFGKTRAGLMGGYAHSDVKTDVVSIDTDTDSLFAGAYGRMRFGKINLDGSLLLGYEWHDTDRLVVDNLNGFEWADGDYGSFFLSPSVAVSSEYAMSDKIAFRPSASMTYSVGWYDGYNESGTTQSNLSFDDRTAQALILRLQMAAGYAYGESNEVEARVGIKSRHTFNDDIEASLAGNSFRYPSYGDDNVFGGFFGARLIHAVTDRININGDVEYAISEGDERQFTGQLGLEFHF